MLCRFSGVPRSLGKTRPQSSQRAPACQPLLDLTLAVLAERRDGDLRERDGPQLVALRRVQQVLAVDPGELDPNMDQAGIQVDILPAQPESFGLPKADRHRDGVQRLQAVPLDLVQEDAGRARVSSRCALSAARRLAPVPGEQRSDARVVPLPVRQGAG